MTPEVPPIRVLVVEDVQPIVAALVRVLNEVDGIEVIGTADSVIDAEELSDEFVPNVVVTDFGLLDGNGIDLARSLVARHPAIKILLLTGLGLDPEVIQRAKASGCAGVMSKASELRTTLPDAILRIARGERIFS